jgi:HlyD family secretion protein
VVEVHIKEGDMVKAGELLVRLDPIDATARLDSARARIQRLRAAGVQADADLEKAIRDATRSGNLSARGVATATEVADAGTVLARARAAIQMIRQELAEAEAMERTSKQELDRTQIRAPIDGVVSGLTVEVGEVAIPGTPNLPGALLMTVTNLEKVRVRTQVDEADVPMVESGQAARIYPQSDQRTPVAGRVDRVAAKGKKVAGGEVVSFETFVTIDDSQHRLRPGMTTTVEIEVRQVGDALGVPVQAVVHRRRKDLPDTAEVRAWAERNARSPGEKAQEAELRYVQLVFVNEGGIARARPVETGLSDEKHIEVKSGLGPEDRVITGPFRALDEMKDGSPVVPESGRAGVR